MILKEITSVDPIAMITAVVSWYDATVPTMKDKLRVTTDCIHTHTSTNVWIVGTCRVDLLTVISTNAFT